MDPRCSVPTAMLIIVPDRRASCALRGPRATVIITKTPSPKQYGYAQGGARRWAPRIPQASPSDTLAAMTASTAAPNEGPERIRELLNLGARFDEANGALALGQEAAHSSRRIAHAGGDATGREIHRTLSQAARLQVGIALRERTLLVDLLVAEGHAIGALLLHLDTEQLSGVLARRRAASRGTARLLAHDEPLVTTGDGIAAAYRAGARWRTWSSSVPPRPWPRTTLFQRARPFAARRYLRMPTASLSCPSTPPGRARPGTWWQIFTTDAMRWLNHSLTARPSGGEV